MIDLLPHTLTSKLPEEIMNILSKEQSFLAELKANLRYSDVHPYSLLDLVHNACVVKDGNIIPLLQNAVADTIEIGLKDKDVIAYELKDTNNLKSTYINLDKALDAVPKIYEVKRKKIQLDSTTIKEVQQQHSGTVELLNEYLRDDFEDESNSIQSQEINSDEIKIEKISDEEIDEMIDIITEKVKISNTTKVTFFSFDKKYINDYGVQNISKYYESF
jgi:hypothetical protein